MKVSQNGAHLIPGLLLAALVLLADQYSKWLVMGAAQAKTAGFGAWLLQAAAQEQLQGLPAAFGVKPLAGFLNLVFVWNPGVSFGIFSAAQMPLLLVVAALAIAAVLLVLLFRAEGCFAAAAYGLIIGGALGNVLDRARFGAVLDFIDVHVKQYHWPAFNIADSSICLGAGLLILAAFTETEKEKKK